MTDHTGRAGLEREELYGSVFKRILPRAGMTRV